MKKPVFLAFVGPCASGKSTYADLLKEKCVVKIFSSDEYREKMYGNRKDQSHNDKIWSQLYTDLRESLKRGENCVLDATNCSVKSRLKAIEAIKNVDCHKIALIFSTSADLCFVRNKQREEEKRVPDDVVYKFIRGFEIPLPWEGWDEIYFWGYDKDFSPKYDKNNRDSILSMCKNFSQKTPHHSYTLKKHLEQVAAQFPDGEDRILRSAAFCHDIGKKIAEWAWTEKEEEGVRHYYNHDKISCYYMLSHLEAFECNTWDEILEVLWLINYHMDYRNWRNSDAALQKWTNRVGSRWMEDMARLVRADEIGSGSGDYAYHNLISKKIKEGYYISHQDELVPEDFVANSDNFSDAK